MPRMVYTTDKQIEAVAFELAERFFKRTGGNHSMQDLDDLAQALKEAIHQWLVEGGGSLKEPERP